VTLVFTDSCSPQQVQLLPEAFAEYSAGAKVGDEVKHFSVSDSEVRVDSFLKRGPAQEAGVDTGWVLDLDRTLGQSTGVASGLTKEQLLKDADSLLAMSGVTLVFVHPRPQREMVACYYGQACSSESESSGESGRWNRLEVQGACVDFEFETDGDGGDEPDSRWGVWLLVLPAREALPSQEEVNTLAERWMKVTSCAMGCKAAPSVERDQWDEARLRALCKRHGWEFEWQTEDGERRRRMRERRGLFPGSVDLAEAARAAARGHPGGAAPELGAAGTPEGQAEAVLPDGYKEEPRVGAAAKQAA